MQVQVLFFGATADLTGQRQIDLEVPVASKANDVFKKLSIDYPQLTKHRLHLSVNQQYATGDERLNDGDEIAVFTAVSGG